MFAHEGHEAADVESSSAVLSVEPWAALGGQAGLTAGPLDDGARTYGPEFSLPGGSPLTIHLSPSWRVTTWSSHIRVTPGAGTYGCQLFPRGFGLLALAGVDFEADLESSVDVAGGTLAQFRLRRPDVGPRTYSIWQGVNTDVASFDFASLEQAIRALSLFRVTDTTTPSVRPLQPQWTIQSQRLTLAINVNDLVVALAPRAEVSNLPKWPGTPGRGGTFYSVASGADGSTPDSILFVAEAAVATIRKVKPSDRRSLEDLVAEARDELTVAA